MKMKTKMKTKTQIRARHEIDSGRHGFTVRPLRGPLALPSFGPSPPSPCRKIGAHISHPANLTTESPGADSCQARICGPSQPAEPLQEVIKRGFAHVP